MLRYVYALTGVLASHTSIWVHGGPTTDAFTTEQPTVVVKNGTLTGIHSPSFNQDFFLGVPFAQPPAGPLRFHTPVSLNQSFEDVYTATKYAPMCPGYGAEQIGQPISEDCLYLNIIRPAGIPHHEKLPTAVWIHGGAYAYGGTRNPRYNLSYIVEDSVAIGKPIIAVSIAYRLAGWGFLASQEVTDSGHTNLALRDQRLALQWVKENIGCFGGDPTKTTIWGESAGAGSVGHQLTAYNGRDDGLFWAAVMQSSNPINAMSYRNESQYEERYQALLEAANCGGSTDSLACLRAAPFKIIDAHFNATGGGNWNPIVDGDFVARYGSEQLADGAFVHVPIIDGTNTDEGTFLAVRGANTTEQFIAAVTDTKPSTVAYIPGSAAADLLAHYPFGDPEYQSPSDSQIGTYQYPVATYGTLYKSSAAYWGDVVFHASRRATCQTWAKANVPAYCYRFNTRPLGVPFTFGVSHFLEVAFVFDNLNGPGYETLYGASFPHANLPQSYHDLATVMSSSWISFFHDRDPDAWRTGLESSSRWPVYDAKRPQNIVWDANTTTLAYTEPDTWRQRGIEWINQNAATYQR